MISASSVRDMLFDLDISCKTSQIISQRWGIVQW